MHYVKFLAQLHSILDPQDYLEIGVRRGRSLELAQNNAVGVDPNYSITHTLNENTELLKMTSDAYFETLPEDRKFDLVFVDGMHLFEYAFRDVCNAAKHLKPGGMIVMDDILPTSSQMALRKRETAAWTGDVWKVLQAVDDHASEVNYLLIDTKPTGLALFYGPGCAHLPDLMEKHDALEQKYANEDFPVPDHLLSRETATPAEQVLQFVKDIASEKA